MYEGRYSRAMCRGCAVPSVETMTTDPFDLDHDRAPLAARVDGLFKTYGSGDGVVHALDGVSIGIPTSTFHANRNPGRALRWIWVNS